MKLGAVWLMLAAVMVWPATAAPYDVRADPGFRTWVQQNRASIHAVDRDLVLARSGRPELHVYPGRTGLVVEAHARIDFDLRKYGYALYQWTEGLNREGVFRSPVTIYKVEAASLCHELAYPFDVRAFDRAVDLIDDDWPAFAKRVEQLENHLVVDPPQPLAVWKVRLEHDSAIDMIWIPPTVSPWWRERNRGQQTFEIGSPHDEPLRDDDETLTPVRLRDGVWLSRTEVTQHQWETIVHGNPAPYDDPDKPVVHVSWNDCDEFIRRLNLQFALQGFRLPTEAEWEFAAKGGQSADRYRLLSGEQGRPPDAGMHPPDDWGLRGLLGGVWEWCDDYYAPYPGGLPVDPRGPPRGTACVIRGGAWNVDLRYHRPPYRGALDPDARRPDVGLRLACGPNF